MWLLMVALAVLALRWLEIGPFAHLSWWWVGAVFGLAFLWFEYFERMLGLEGKRAMDEQDAARKRRIAQALERDRKGPGPRG